MIIGIHHVQPSWDRAYSQVCHRRASAKQMNGTLEWTTSPFVLQLPKGQSIKVALPE